MKPEWIVTLEREEGDTLEGVIAWVAETSEATGYTVTDLAREYGVPVKRLYYHAKKYGIKLPRGVSAVFRETISECMTARNNARRDKWQPHEIKFLRKVYPSQAITIAAIARRIGRTPTSVERQAAKIGVTRTRFKKGSER